MMIGVFIMGAELATAVNPTPFGYDFLDNGKIFHMWNSKLDFYFNVTSGLQFTNNYNVYWNRNIYCIGYKNLTTGIWDDKCNDGSILNTFSWKIYTDNLTYVSAQGFKNITFAGRQVEVGLNYSLNNSINDLIIRPSLKNVDSSNILEQIRFKWHSRDILVGDGINNYLQANGTEINLANSWNITRTNITPQKYIVTDADTGEWFQVKWNYNDNSLSVISEPSQYNAPLTLILNDTRLNVNQTKATNLFWIDATCILTIHPNAPANNSRFSDLDNIHEFGGCVDLDSICPGSANCPGIVRISRRFQGASGFTTLFSVPSTSADCSENENLLRNVSIPHNNQTDFRLTFTEELEVLDICQPSISPFRTGQRDNWWLNNHTPTTHNVSINIFNDTYVNFDGINDIVNATAVNNPKLRDFLNNYSATGWSLLGWFNTRNPAIAQVIMAQQDGGGTGRTFVGLSLSGCAGKLATNFAGITTCANLSLNSNQWYQMALIYNTTSIRIFINGTFYNSSTLNPDENAAGNVLFATNKNLAQDFNGSMDNYLFYNRSLNDTEVQIIYNKSKISNPTINQTDLQVWYRLDESSDNITNDTINNYFASLEGNTNWTNLGTGGLYCANSYQDLDADLQNISNPPPYFTWYEFAVIPQPQFNNNQFILTTNDNYVCCDKVEDSVFATGNEQFVCSGNFLQNQKIRRQTSLAVLVIMFIIAISMGVKKEDEK
jgi:hypothetical protein